MEKKYSDIIIRKLDDVFKTSEWAFVPLELKIILSEAKRILKLGVNYSPLSIFAAPFGGSQFGSILNVGLPSVAQLPEVERQKTIAEYITKALKHDVETITELLQRQETREKATAEKFDIDELVKRLQEFTTTVFDK